MSEFLKIEKDKNYFVTFTLVDWIDLFTRATYANMLVDSIKFCQQTKGLRLYAYCIMSNHVHMIAAAELGSLGDILRDLKGYTAREITKDLENNLKESRRDWMLKAFRNAAIKNRLKQRYQVWQHEN